jgi:hypothetical protein
MRMNTMLAKLRRCGSLSLLLGLLLFGNEFVHLCCHGHRHDAAGNVALFGSCESDRSAESFARSHRLPEISHGEFPCPFCSVAIDLLCTPASVGVQFEPLPSTVVRRDLTPPVIHFSFSHQPRSPPLV